MLNLKIARMKKGMTQKELASKVGVSEMSLAQYEQGRVKPRIETLILLSKKLEVSTDYLLGLED